MSAVKSPHSEPISLLLRRAEGAFLEGDQEAARLFLDRVRKQAGASAGQWEACARLNELLGRPHEALEDYARALKKQPGANQLFLRRARIFLELGLAAEAKGEVRKALLAGLTQAQVREVLGVLLKPLREPEEPNPSEMDRAFYQSRGRRKAIERFLQLFKGRPGAYARQWFDPKEGKSGYFPVLEPLTAELVEAHLEGKMTLGLYLLDPQARVHFAALDLDLGKDAIARVREDADFGTRMGAAMRGLMAAIERVSAKWELPVVFERSGHKGVHAWYFFQEPVPAWAAKTVLVALRESVSPPPPGIQLEVFPKQVSLSGKGYGNLIKLPLGVHRVTGKKSVFLDVKGIPVPDSLNYLLGIRTIPAALVLSLAERLGAVSKGQVVPLPQRRPLPPTPQKAEPGPPPARVLDKTTQEAYARVLEGCALIRYLVRKAREFRHLSFDERKVILGVLGHLPGGAQLVHHVISRCADYDPQITGHFISRVPKAPLGCRGIRRKLFYLDQTRCGCKFGTKGKEYPTPVLHACLGEEGESGGRGLLP